MELYTLNLARALHWKALTDTSWPTVIESAHAAEDGTEHAAWWLAEDIVTESEDGPKAVSPLPPPYKLGRSLPSGREPPTENPELRDAELELPAAKYLFAQATLAGMESVREAVEWFARETWWIGGKTQGPIIARLVREDGKTALQILRALVTAPQ